MDRCNTKTPVKNDTRPARRRKVARMLASGKSTREIACDLNVMEDTVRRDIKELRRQAAERRPWQHPTACAAAFIEAAETALQKVRAAQNQSEHDTTIYHNLVKLEWTMLIKFIEMSSQQATAKTEVQNNENEDLSNYTNEQLLQKARELGIDVTGFERALRPAEAARAEETPPDDLGEAA